MRMKSTVRGLFLALISLWNVCSNSFFVFFFFGADMVIDIGVYVVLIFARVARQTVFSFLDVNIVFKL